jgi:MscS family membrane protein
MEVVMDISNTILGFEIVGNKLWRIVALFGIILVALLVGRIAKFVFKRSAKKSENQQRFVTATTLNAIARSVLFLSAALGISLGLMFLELKAKVTEVADTLSTILLSIGICYMIYWLVEVPTSWLAKMAVKTESKLDDMLVPIIRKSLRVTIVILLLVHIVQILSDKPITSIIAGLGIGGLAFALAAQDTIKNFFGSIVLFTDKPFEMGDRIVVDGHDGPVEEVGLRSTKIRTFDGHLVTVPNANLANRTIQNIGRRPYIRRVANLTITYDTPPEKIDRALEIVKEILDNHEGMKEGLPPRVFFSDFNPYSLNIIVFYWYHPPDYWNHMAFSERFNKEVFRRFSEEGIEFAFPTQTLYLAGDPSRALTVGMRNEGAMPDK